MCYSANVSLTAFVIGWMGCAWLVALQQYVVAAYFAFITLMQFYDWLFWLNPSKTVFNAMLTKVAMISNHLQPLVLAALVVLVLKKPLQLLSKVLLGFYIVVICIYTAYVWQAADYTVPGLKALTSCGDRTHLIWKWNHIAPRPFVHFTYGLYLALSMALIYQHFPAPLGLILTVIVFCSCVISAVVNKGKLIGRMWCHIAAFIPIALAAWLAWTQQRAKT